MIDGDVPTAQTTAHCQEHTMPPELPPEIQAEFCPLTFLESGRVITPVFVYDVAIVWELAYRFVHTDNAGCDWLTLRQRAPYPKRAKHYVVRYCLVSDLFNPPPKP